MNQGTFYSVPDEHIQRIQNELQPLRKQIADYEQNVAESKRRLSRGQSEMTTALTPLRTAFRGVPRRPDVVNVLQNSRNELNQLESSQATTRPVITQPGHPPARIRHYIKGTYTIAFGEISQCCGAWGGGLVVRAPASYQCCPGSNPAPDAINGLNSLLVLGSSSAKIQHHKLRFDLNSRTLNSEFIRALHGK